MNQAITFEDKTVLLVEDELYLVEEISNQLKTLGVKHVLAATNLEDATDHSESASIDLALLDVNLPRGQTTLEIGNDLAAKGVPVVYFSGLDVAGSKELARSHEFLEKPLSVSRLKASMQRAMLRASSSLQDKKMADPEVRQSG